MSQDTRTEAERDEATTDEAADDADDDAQTDEAQTDEAKTDDAEDASDGVDGGQRADEGGGADDGDGEDIIPKPEITDEHREKAKEMAKAYEDDRPTIGLPGTGNTVTGQAVADWVDEDGSPKFGEVEEEIERQ